MSDFTDCIRRSNAHFNDKHVAFRKCIQNPQPFFFPLWKLGKVLQNSGSERHAASQQGPVTADLVTDFLLIKGRENESR